MFRVISNGMSCSHEDSRFTSWSECAQEKDPPMIHRVGLWEAMEMLMKKVCWRLIVKDRWKKGDSFPSGYDVFECKYGSNRREKKPVDY